MNGFSARHPALSLGRAYARHLPSRLGAGIVGALTAGGMTGARGLRRHPFTGLTRTRDGDTFQVDTVDGIEGYLHVFGVWEPDLQAWLRGRLRPGDTVIDIGANIGAVTVPAARLVGPAGAVVAIEAIPGTAERLRTNLELNGLSSHVRVVQAAASDHVGDLTLYLPSKYNRGGTSQVDAGDSAAAYTVPCAPVTDLATTAELAAARIIKIDVEGAEPEVVAGLTPALDRLRDDVEIQVEVAPERMRVGGFTVDDVFGPLEDVGFLPYLLRNDYHPARYVSNTEHPEPPRRIRRPIREQCDVVFSRIDAEVLRPVST